jgi:hypothetical protein
MCQSLGKVHTKRKEQEVTVRVQRKGRGKCGSLQRKPLTATEIPRLPACVVRGATGAVTENVLPSLAHFEKKRDKVSQKRMEDVRGVRDHEESLDN